LKKKRLVILFLQICIVLISAFMIIKFANSKIRPIEVFVYSRDIEDFSIPLKAGDVKKVEVPAEAVSKDFARKGKDIVGKYLDSKVSAGQYVYNSQLVEKEDIDIFKTLDLSKYRKISLPITYVDAFAGNIKKGDKIDLVYVGQDSKETTDSVESGQSEEQSGGDFTYSKVFLQNVPVYSVSNEDGYKFVDHSDKIQGYEESKEKVDTEKDSGSLGIITLAVTLDQAEQIEARVNAGKIKFIGRFPGSKDYNTLGYVLGNYGKVFSGKGSAETDNLTIEEDDFDQK